MLGTGVWMRFPELAMLKVAFALASGGTSTERRGLHNLLI